MNSRCPTILNARRWAACLAFLVAPTLLAQAQLAITPTTTLSAETANNTSASGGFASQKNGNAAAGNVSKAPIRNLLYPGSNTRIYAAVMPWFGRTDHMSVGYNSADPAQIAAQVTDMMSRGIQGAVIPWYGPNPDVESAMAVNFMHEAESRGGAFEFAIMIDVGALGAYAQQNGCDVTTQLIADMKYIASTFYGSPAYSHVNGRPLLFFFGVEAYYIDWAQARAAAPGNPEFMIRNPGAFGESQADGGYSWVEIDSSNPYNMGLDYLDTFYTAAQQSSAKDVIGSTYKGFNDTLAAWSGNRVLDQQCGKTWLATFARLNAHYSSSNPLRALQLVTWNDYEEGTEMETGIDNCATVQASVSGKTLNWSPQWSDSNGTESTIDHYRIFISTDGEHLMRLSDVPAATHALDLSQYNLAAGTYILYVEAMGQPSVVNRFSKAVGFNPSDQSPIASLAVPSSGTVGAPISISGTGSFDPDGSIASAVIDFGDGSPAAQGLSATHTYQNAGHYRVTLTVTDNGGLTSSATSPIAVAAGPGVVIVSPGANATLDSPVHVLATAVMSNPVAAMRVEIDGATIYWAAVSILDASLKINARTHNLTVVAQDSTGATSSATTTLTVSPNDVAPVAELSVAPFGGGNQVMACTAASNDDGFISTSMVDFGDGTTASGPTALHTYAKPGTYTVTASVTDNVGLQSSASSKVTVGAPAPAASADFALALSSSAATVKAGQAATLSASVSSLGTFGDNVTFSCTGLPLGAGCTFNPQTVTPGAGGQANTTVTISTAAAGLASMATVWKHGGTLALMSPLLAMVFTGLGCRKRARIALLLLIIAAGLIALQACGGSAGGASAPATTATPAGSYTVNLVATSSGTPAITHSRTFTLTVQ